MFHINTNDLIMVEINNELNFSHSLSEANLLLCFEIWQIISLLKDECGLNCNTIQN